MAKCVYWQSDNYPAYLVRNNNGIMEDYKKGRGWAENPERADVIFGVDLNYTKISEDEAFKIISQLEKGN